MKSSDQITTDEARANLQKAADDLSSSAKANREALEIEGESVETDVRDQAISEVQAEEPSASQWLDDSNYENKSGGLGPSSKSSYDAKFNDAKRAYLNQLANGIDKIMPVVIQEAIDTIDELRNLADEIAAEALKIAAAAAAGQLLPIFAGDVEDFGDSIEEAKTQTKVVRRDVANGQARREAARRQIEVRSGQDLAPQVRALQQRPIVRSQGIPEREEDDDAGVSLVSGSATNEDRAAVSDDHARRIQTLLRSSALDRISYIAICAALNSMTRGQEQRDRAVRTVEKLKRILDAIKEMIGEGFAQSILDSVQEFANNTLQNIEDSLQSKLDSVDDFLKTIASLPGPFVATVRLMGDVPDQAPVLNFFASQCKIKGAKFCDMQGLLEVAASLDIDFGLRIPQPPMIGRAVLILDAPEPDQVTFQPHAQDVPQEADLIIVATTPVSGTQVLARFAREDRPVSGTDTGASEEVADYFGSGPGRLMFFAEDESTVEEIPYVQATFNALTGIYTFSLGSPATIIHVPTQLASVDDVVYPTFWDDVITYPVGSSVITVRIAEPARLDINLAVPGRMILGVNEQDTFRGEYDASVADVIRTFEDVFEPWHVGAQIQIRNSLGVLQSRTISVVTGPRQVTYSGGNIAPTRPMSRGQFQFVARHYEIVNYTSIVAAYPTPTLDGEDQLFVVNLSAPTTKPHGRLFAVPQKTLRVIPDARDDFLDETVTPADPEMRASQSILPAGSFIVRGTYEDALRPEPPLVSQDSYYTPLLTAAVSGSMYINGQGPIAYDVVEDAGDQRLKFTLPNPGTPSPFVDGARIEVLTTDMLDRFAVDFPDNWADPLDNWLRGLLAEFNKLEAKFCRLLSGTSQEIGVTATAIAIGAGSVSLMLTTARFILVGWLAPMVTGPALERSLAQMRGLGAANAETAAREGRVADLAVMDSSEAAPAGAAMNAAQVLGEKAETQEQANAISRMTAELRGQHESTLVAGNLTSDLKAAQTAEVQRRETGAMALKSIAEDV